MKTKQTIKLNDQIINFTDAKTYFEFSMIMEKLNEGFSIINDASHVNYFLASEKSKQTFPIKSQIFDFLLQMDLIDTSDFIDDNITKFEKTVRFQSIYSFMYEKEIQFFDRSKIFIAHVENLITFIEMLAAKTSRATQNDIHSKLSIVKKSQAEIKKYMNTTFMKKCNEIEIKEVQKIVETPSIDESDNQTLPESV